MHVLTITHNDKEYHIKIDELIDLITTYGDERHKTALIKPTVRNSDANEQRREHLTLARQLLLQTIPDHVGALIINALEHYELIKFAFKCDACKRGFNSVHDLVAHTTEPDSTECLAHLSAKLGINA